MTESNEHGVSYNEMTVIPGKQRWHPAIIRMGKEVYEHIKGKRTLREEYDLVMQKKSQLPKRLRDFVVILNNSLETETTERGSDGDNNTGIAESDSVD